VPYIEYNETTGNWHQTGSEVSGKAERSSNDHSVNLTLAYNKLLNLNMFQNFRGLGLEPLTRYGSWIKMELTNHS